MLWNDRETEREIGMMEGEKDGSKIKREATRDGDRDVRLKRDGVGCREREW